MTDFSRYLIVSDIDGTYLSHGGSDLPARNLEAILRFQRGGGLFTLSTGRIACTVDPGVPHLREAVNAPTVLSNGAVLYDFHKNECYDETLMDKEIVSELLALLIAEKQLGEPIQMSARSGMYFDELTESLARYVAPAHPGTIFVSDPATWPREASYKVLAHGPVEKMAALRKIIQARFCDRVGITTSGPRTLEIQTPYCNKAVGLDKLRRFVGEDRIVVACGDYDNDLEMLMAADIAVCPANACDAVKAIADYVLCDCSEGLIADVIEHIEAGLLQVKRKKGETV